MSYFLTSLWLESAVGHSEVKNSPPESFSSQTELFLCMKSILLHKTFPWKNVPVVILGNLHPCSVYNQEIARTFHPGSWNIGLLKHYCFGPTFGGFCAIYYHLKWDEGLSCAQWSVQLSKQTLKRQSWNTVGNLDPAQREQVRNLGFFSSVAVSLQLKVEIKPRVTTKEQWTQKPSTSLDVVHNTG